MIKALHARGGPQELLEEVEQDEQACEAAARLPGRARREARGRRALAHSNSLQDLVAALAAEPAPRRRPAPVSARALHGGSLPSGVDTCNYTELTCLNNKITVSV